MKLLEWRLRNGKTQIWVAQYLGTSQSTVSRYESGEQIPSAKEMPKVFAMTGGAVTANDFYDLPRRSRASGNADTRSRLVSI